MALQPEAWHDDIVENIYKDNEFMNAAYNADEYVLLGKIVHIPQAGTPSNVAEDRATLPATVSERVDTETTYTLVELTSDPVLIRNIDDIQLSYNKRQSVLTNDFANIYERAAEVLFRKWATGLTADNIFRTSGSATDALISGATGNRKAFQTKDMFKAKTKFDKWGIPKKDRKSALWPEQIAILLQDEKLAVNFTKYADLANGVVGNVAGFAIYERQTVARFNNDALPVLKDSKSAVEVTDNAAALFWHPAFVERALGDVKLFESLANPLYYGDIYSMLIMVGGRGRRADNKGILALVEAASA